MTAKTTQVPALRFPEFEGEWERYNLGEIANFSKGKGISKADIVENGVLECIRYGELYTHYSEVISTIISRTNSNANDLILSKVNDVIIPASGETQIDIAKASCVMKDGVALGGDLNILRLNQNGVFISYYLNSKKKLDIATLAQGISVVHLYASQLSLLNLNLPSLPEQQKIASFLTAVDEKLQQLTRKKALMEQYKKGVMQKIFTQEIRFKPDDGGETFGGWEIKKLGEVADFQKGKGISKSDIATSGRTKCIRYGEIYTRYSEVISQVYSSTNLDESQLFLSKENDVIIPSSGETAIDIAKACCVTVKDIALSGDINVIRSPINGIFLSYYLNAVKREEIASLAQGASVIHLYSGQLAKLVISIPPIQEQQKIASFLSAIDEKINHITTQLQQAQQWKKGLLQGMFV